MIIWIVPPFCLKWHAAEKNQATSQKSLGQRENRLLYIWFRLTTLVSQWVDRFCLGRKNKNWSFPNFLPDLPNNTDNLFNLRCLYQRKSWIFKNLSHLANCEKVIFWKCAMSQAWRMFIFGIFFQTLEQLTYSDS